MKLLEQIQEVLGEVEVTVAREVTKKFEEFKKDRVSSLIDHYQSNPAKGEFVVIINNPG